MLDFTARARSFLPANNSSIMLRNSDGVSWSEFDSYQVAGDCFIEGNHEVACEAFPHQLYVGGNLTIQNFSNIACAPKRIVVEGYALIENGPKFPGFYKGLDVKGDLVLGLDGIFGLDNGVPHVLFPFLAFPKTMKVGGEIVLDCIDRNPDYIFSFPSVQELNLFISEAMFSAHLTEVFAKWRRKPEPPVQAIPVSQPV